MPIYNKLVRDKIPMVIEASGKGYRTRVLDEEEFRKELKLKLREEYLEYEQAMNDQEALEELADMVEVIRSLALVHGSGWDQLETIRAQKAEARGGFHQRIYLIDVE